MNLYTWHRVSPMLKLLLGSSDLSTCCCISPLLFFTLRLQMLDKGCSGAFTAVYEAFLKYLDGGHGVSTPTLFQWLISWELRVKLQSLNGMPRWNPLLWDTCFWQVLGQVLLNQSLLYISLFFTGKKLLFVLFRALWVVWLSDMNVKREHVSLTIYVEFSYMEVFTLQSSPCPFCMFQFSLLLSLLQVCV